MRTLALSLLLITSVPALCTAGYREDFAREFMSKTWAGERVEVNACVDCHASQSMKPAYQEIVDEWRKSWHAQNDIACHDCHGGDPGDPALAMSHQQRGFLGRPAKRDIPDFCGRCHVGILKNYQESGHGRSLRAGRNGPDCTVCHGSHNVQTANIEIITEQRCSRCHTYDRARDMKQALFLVEKKLGEIEDGIRALKRAGIYPEEEQRSLFSAQAEFRTLFHTVDVNLVTERAAEYTQKLDGIEQGISRTFDELRSRKNFSAVLMLLFSAMGIVILLLSRGAED